MLSTLVFKRGKGGVPWAQGLLRLGFVCLLGFLLGAGVSLHSEALAAPPSAAIESMDPYEIPTEPWEEVPAGKNKAAALDNIGDNSGDEGGMGAADSLEFEPLPTSRKTFKDAVPSPVDLAKPVDPFDGVSLERLFSKSKPVIQSHDGFRMMFALIAVLALVLAFFKWIFPRVLPFIRQQQVGSQQGRVRPPRRGPSSQTSEAFAASGPQESSSQQSRPYEVLRSFPVHKHTRIELVSVWERYLLVGATREGSVSLGEVHPPDAHDRQSQSWFEPTRTPQGEPISDVLQRHPAILQACLDCVTERVFPPALPPALSPISPPVRVSSYPSEAPTVYAPSQSSYAPLRPTPDEVTPSLAPEVWSVLNKYLPTALIPPAPLPPPPTAPAAFLPTEPTVSPKPIAPTPYTFPQPQIDESPVYEPPAPVSSPSWVETPPPPSSPLSPILSHERPRVQQRIEPQQPQPLPPALPPVLPVPPSPLPPAPLPEPEFITVLDDYDDIF